MKIHGRAPVELLDGWQQSLEALAADEHVAFHYHDTDEWVVVVGGSIAFFTLAGDAFDVVTGSALWIPRGEVHRAVVGSEGVEYQMFLPVRVPTFVSELTPDELEALLENLEYPEFEDGRGDNGRDFFEKVLSDELVFCRANGVVVDKKAFIDEAFVDKGRSSAGSIRVLNKTEQGLTISTVVNAAGAGGALTSFTNVRFLAVEDRTLRCRLWVNYPQLVPPD